MADIIYLTLNGNNFDKWLLVADAEISAAMLNSVAVHALPSIKAQSIFTLEISAIAAPTAAIADSKVCSYSVFVL